MDNYKIIHKIELGEPGSLISQKELEDAGVNIEALVASGHIDYESKPIRAKTQTEE